MINTKASPFPLDAADLAELLIREVEQLGAKYKLTPQIIVHAIAHHGPNRRDVERFLDVQATRFN